MEDYKTEYICLKQEGANFILNDAPLKLEDNFPYLGSSVLSAERDVNIRQAKGWIAMEL